MEKFPKLERSSNQEKNPESNPSSEEVAALFEKLLEGGEFEEVRKLEDEHGLYLWDIIVRDENGDTEYSYMRKGRHPKGEASITAVHMTLLDKDDIPVGGHAVAKYINNEWKLIP